MSNPSEGTVLHDEYLSQEELTTLKEILESQLANILEQSRAAVGHLTETREADPDHLDLAVTESNRDFTLRMADRERRLLGKIRKAIQRMNEGEYGVCESCGSPITFKRLMARPVATACIDCKTETEQLERRRRAF